MNSGRAACQAARAIAQTTAEVRATRVSMADQPKTGGRCRRKKTRTRPKNRSMLERLPNSVAVQGGGSPSRLFWRLGFQGMTAAAPERYGGGASVGDTGFPHST